MILGVSWFILLILTGYTWEELSACISWMAPFAITVRDSEIVHMKTFENIMFSDCHNIQTHVVSLEMLVSSIISCWFFFCLPIFPQKFERQKRHYKLSWWLFWCHVSFNAINYREAFASFQMINLFPDFIQQFRNFSPLNKKDTRTNQFIKKIAM